MTSRRIISLLILAVVIASVLEPTRAAEPFLVELSDGARLELTLPDHWKAKPEVSGGATTLELTPTDRRDFVVLLTTFVLPPGSPLSTEENFKKTIEQRGNLELAGALQSSLELTEIKGEHSLIYLYHLTDRNPERGPGDYREAHQGGVLLGTHFASVTILTHPGDDAIVNQAIEVLESATILGE